MNDPIVKRTEPVQETEVVQECQAETQEQAQQSSEWDEFKQPPVSWA